MQNGLNNMILDQDECECLSCWAYAHGVIIVCNFMRIIAIHVDYLSCVFVHVCLSVCFAVAELYNQFNPPRHIILRLLEDSKKSKMLKTDRIEFRPFRNELIFINAIRECLYFCSLRLTKVA